MQLSAEVLVNIYQPNLPVDNSRNRWVMSWLMVGRKSLSNTDAYLLIRSRSDKSGKYFKLKDNVEKIFDGHIFRGKCTIRLKNPPKEILIRRANDMSKLSAFLHVLRQNLNDNQPGHLQFFPPATTQQIERTVTRLVIRSRQEYLISTNFPHTLEDLCASSINLRQVDNRISSLRHLRTLDLSGNQIRTLPDAWDNLNQLADLNFSDNGISSLPSSLFNKCCGLTSLNFNHNNIEHIPAEIWNLSRLVTLKLSRNSIKDLPVGISRARQLRVLDLSHNLILVFPADMTRMAKLDTIDLSVNVGCQKPFVEDFIKLIDEPSPRNVNKSEFVDMVFDVANLHHAPKLIELAARAVKNSRINYTAEDVGHLKAYLDNEAHECKRCKQFCYKDFGVLIKLISLHNLVDNIIGPCSFWCLFYVCSLRCFRALKRWNQCIF
ncbi:hypothetical protein HELRODRAFT_186045 [Helobdella robusta]|uniref:PIF1/LRR1 pleckstrin homology domain-containing protein n=1 Tax=Helobdella robusta TaxID=6412 RepID=T1FNL2_HELRO|nr:hypothetical protein HELRODRAFT_186045 [Helobdella robusta]ESN93976.1 hypothetical protein HELRODRAFT_186045 [Helobdella robusta]